MDENGLVPGTPFFLGENGWFPVFSHQSIDHGFSMCFCCSQGGRQVKVQPHSVDFYSAVRDSQRDVKELLTESLSRFSTLTEAGEKNYGEVQLKLSEPFRIDVYSM